MRLIDADALIEILAVMQGRCNTKTELVHNSKIWQQVKDMPTVDAVPVIRCKDCKHAHKCYGDVIWASKGGGYIYKPLGTDGFCSRAERKEE